MTMVTNRKTNEEMQQERDARKLYLAKRKGHEALLATCLRWREIKAEEGFAKILRSYKQDTHLLLIELKTCKKSELEAKQQEIRRREDFISEIDRLDDERAVDRSRLELEAFVEKNGLFIHDLVGRSIEQIEERLQYDDEALKITSPGTEVEEHQPDPEEDVDQEEETPEPDEEPTPKRRGRKAKGNNQPAAVI